MSPATPPLIAAITPQDADDADTLVSRFADAMIAEGWRVRGLIQEQEGADADPSCAITLLDLDDNRRHSITQDLGACSTACRLDPAAMAEAGAVLRRIVREGADLAIVNRFGKQEAEGRGFAAEMLALMSCGIPVLTIVQGKYLAAWRHFTGDFAVELPAERAALDNWFAGHALTDRARPPAAEAFA